MGMVLGKIPVETPKYELIKACKDYTIWKYVPVVAAQITYSPAEFKGDKDGGFTVLAKYIGVFETPQNAKPEEKIAMTAPVISKTGKKIAMTAPVVTKEDGGGGEMVTMEFLLPPKYQKAEEAPNPVDVRVVIREVGEKKYGVVKFSGVASDGVVAMKMEKLMERLVEDGYKIFVG